SHGLALAGAAALLAVAVGAVQTGLIFVPSRLLPDGQRFMPGKVWTQKFRMDALVAGALAGAGGLVGLLVGWLGIRHLRATATALAEEPLALDGDLGRQLAALADPLVAAGAGWLATAAVVALIDA